MLAALRHDVESGQSIPPALLWSGQVRDRHGKHVCDAWRLTVPVPLWKDLKWAKNNPVASSQFVGPRIGWYRRALFAIRQPCEPWRYEWLWEPWKTWQV